MAPGPEVAMQTPTSPVNLAWAQAMKAAISSCRTWMNSIFPLARFSAPMMPLMPSPGRLGLWPLKRARSAHSILPPEKGRKSTYQGRCSGFQERIRRSAG